MQPGAHEGVAAALKTGTINAPPFGTTSYRLSSDEGRIKLLVGGVRAQRDVALKGQGMPWLMLPGTPGALW